jgi:hypothetical protein
MPSLLRRTSLALFALLSLFLIWFGVTYATVADMLSFHAAAVPEAVRGQMKPLYFALMTLIGGAATALGVLGLYVVAAPLRRRIPGAASALAATYAIAFTMAAITAEKLAAATGSPTSWHLMGIGLLVTFTALTAHTLSTRLKGPAQPVAGR